MLTSKCSKVIVSATHSIWPGETVILTAIAEWLSAMRLSRASHAAAAILSGVCCMHQAPPHCLPTSPGATLGAEGCLGALSYWPAGRRLISKKEGTENQNEALARQLAQTRREWQGRNRTCQALHLLPQPRPQPRRRPRQLQMACLACCTSCNNLHVANFGSN